MGVRCREQRRVFGTLRAVDDESHNGSDLWHLRKQPPSGIRKLRHIYILTCRWLLHGSRRRTYLCSSMVSKKQDWRLPSLSLFLALGTNLVVHIRPELVFLSLSCSRT